jgi:hypothetical protein
MVITRDFSWYMVFFILSLFALSHQTVGYDFYHHAFSTSSLENLSTNQVRSIAGFDFQRYILFHHFFLVFSLAGIPFAYTISVAQAFLMKNILMECWRIKGGYKYIFLILLSIPFVKFSALSFGLLFLLSALINNSHKKKYTHLLIISMAIHPVSLVLSFLYGIFYFKNLFVSVMSASLVLILSNLSIYI